MSDDDREDGQTYVVVRNHEEQDSIWPSNRELPLGWMSEGTPGTKAACLAYIKSVWTDMRPSSLRHELGDE